MAFIGNTPQTQGFAPAIDYFNGDGTTVTFTLSRPVASVAQMIVAIDNVIQNPSSAFTVTGNSITFTSAPLSGTNNIWVEYTSLITTYAAISQDPSVIGDITASGGYLATGDFGNTFTDGTIVDYVTGNARITTGPADGLTIYNGGTASRTALTAWDQNGNQSNAGVAASSWASSIKSLELPGGGMYTYTASPNYDVGIYNNAYYDGQWKYKNSGTGATRLFLTTANSASPTGVRFVISTAPSGTAGNTVAFTDQFSISNAGYVTLTSQPRFHANCNGSTTTSGSTLLFQNVRVNTSNSYNSSTSTFTAPISGTYFFYGSVMANTGTGRLYWRMYKNGADTAYVQAGGDSTNYGEWYASMTITLAAGDYINCILASGTTYPQNSQEQYFGGWLLG